MAVETSPGRRPEGFSEGPRLDGLRVLVMTSGHRATDGRIYAKEARSLQGMGADIKVVGVLDGEAAGPVPILPVPKAGSRWLRFLWQPWRCLWAARRERPQILHFHDAEMLMVLPAARARWPRCRFVYDVHEDFPNLLLIRDWLPRPLRPFVRVVANALEKTLASLANGIVSVTPALTERFPGRPRATAYNFVSREFFERAAETAREPRSREFDLVHLGTLSSKRAAFLAETIREFHRLRPGARSLIIGVGDEERGSLSGLLPESCRVLGKRPFSEIPSLLGNAKVGIDVHPWLGRHLEVAFPVKVSEYMAAGCAVVTSAMPVLSRVLSEAGVRSEQVAILEGGSPLDYAKAVTRFVEAIDRGKDPGGDLRLSALRHMTWEAEADKIARLYLTLLGDR